MRENERTAPRLTRTEKTAVRRERRVVDAASVSTGHVAALGERISARSATPCRQRGAMERIWNPYGTLAIVLSPVTAIVDVPSAALLYP